jgi:hypothetical protein
MYETKPSDENFMSINEIGSPFSLVAETLFDLCSISAVASAYKWFDFYV